MTKLEAVNEILSRVGISPVPALDPGGAGDAAQAERCLDREELNTQSLDWHYNRRRDVPLSPILFTFDNAAWTASTRTLAQSGKFTSASTGQTITITVGATAGSPVGADDLHAHGITFALASTGSTPRGPGSQLYTALGATAQVHSPLNNEVAELLLPDLCSSGDILIEFEFVDATEANASVEMIG